MKDSFRFHPPRNKGLIVNGAAALILSAGSAASIMLGLNQQIGAYFILFLIISLLLAAPVPLILYRAYALMHARYLLDRDGLRLRWGLRAEDIPLLEVEWVRYSGDMAADLHLPRLRWPGAVLGTVQCRDLGPVEFMASTAEPILLIATPQKVYAISPEDPEAFIRAYRLTTEMGSLAHIPPASVLPAAYLAQVWSDALARGFLIVGFVLSLLIFIGISLEIPTRPAASLGFYPNGEPLPPVPAEQMLLLPILGAFFYLSDLAAGLFFYRKANAQKIAYLLWGSGALTQILLIAAAIMIL